MTQNAAIRSQKNPAVLPFNSLKRVLIFQQYDSWEPEPSWSCPQLYSFINSSQSWNEQRSWHYILPGKHRTKAGISHTERHAVPALKECCLPTAWTTLCLHDANALGGVIIFKRNLIAERPACAVVSLQMSDNPLQVTDRQELLFYFHPLGQTSGEYLSLNKLQQQGYFKTSCHFKVLFVHTDT